MWKGSEGVKTKEQLFLKWIKSLAVIWIKQCLNYLWFCSSVVEVITSWDTTNITPCIVRLREVSVRINMRLKYKNVGLFTGLSPFPKTGKMALVSEFLGQLALNVGVMSNFPLFFLIQYIMYLYISLSICFESSVSWTQIPHCGTCCGLWPWQRCCQNRDCDQN